jgi:hypothetical protein
MSEINSSSETSGKGLDLVATSSCQICGAPVCEHRQLCMDCEIEQSIRDRTALIEM